jgi:hypothetical protein
MIDSPFAKNEDSSELQTPPSPFGFWISSGEEVVSKSDLVVPVSSPFTKS